MIQDWMSSTCCSHADGQAFRFLGRRRRRKIQEKQSKKIRSNLVDINQIAEDHDRQMLDLSMSRGHSCFEYSSQGTKA